MASDGREIQPVLTWSQRVPGRNAPKAFPAPDVSAVTLPGVPAGLFSRKSLDSGITLKVGSWNNLPGPGETEYIRLQIARVGSEEYEQVDEVEYTQGTTDIPFDIRIPSDFLLRYENEGAFKIRYEHENWVGTPAYSADVPVFIDKTPPNGTVPPGKMTFTITPPFTDLNLAGLTEVEGTIPDWTGAGEGDKVAFAWVKDKLPDDPDDIKLIDTVELGADRKVKFPIKVITDSEDGKYCGGYVIIDKAGNRSRISFYDLIPVALGPFPPLPLPSLSVPEAADGSVDRADAVRGVHVEFLKILNAKPTDDIAIIWGANELPYRTPIGSNPPDLMSVAVIWTHMRDEYGAATGLVETPVKYRLYRGEVLLGEVSDTVKVDFSITGPVNPLPEPGNPAIHQLEVFGDSGVANKLVVGDQGKRVFARIKLYDPLTIGDALQARWNGKVIGASRPIDPNTETPGEEIEIDLDWAVIEKEGNNPKMPVTYTLTNPAHTNPQEPEKPTDVEIVFLTVTLPLAEPQNLISNRLTCRSLYVEGGKVGFKYLIPPSDYLKQGMTVDVEWNAYHTYSAPVLIPEARLATTLGPISADEEANGVIWFIEPYDKHILPTWTSPTNQSGKAEVIYTLKVGGIPVPSSPSSTQVVLSAGSGTCVLS